MSLAYVVGEFLDPAGEACGVRLQPILGVPFMGEPAVVDAHILIASLLPALLHHNVSHLHVELLAV